MWMMCGVDEAPKLPLLSRVAEHTHKNDVQVAQNRCHEHERKLPPFLTLLFGRRSFFDFSSLSIKIKCFHFLPQAGARDSPLDSLSQLIKKY